MPLDRGVCSFPRASFPTPPQIAKPLTRAPGIQFEKLQNATSMFI